ncbi:MAG: aspartate carbamoyltransferase catalytic subunit [Actinomycetota bacterium]|jgi:aspartate carbamoyltransferase catalytic subunit|tara:strand:- start:24068 stop:25057 length:990 start_codon:yes stop_codon:yes gene_type:complete
MKKHLLSIDDLNAQEVIEILDTAFQLANISDGATKKLPTLRGRTVVNLFFEDSTRTRISFESAAKRLSADVINFNAKGSSVSKGESLKDTAQTLQAMGADAVVIRHNASGAAQRLADSGWISASVINAGDGTHEHPTQALLDAYTIREKFPEFKSDFSGLHVAIVGDILHSRVARSNVLLLTKLGAKVTLVSPPTLMPVGISAWPVEISYDLDEVIGAVDVLMVLRLQSERMAASYFPTEREYSRGYGLDKLRLDSLKKSAIVMHPGPMIRGLEISAESADSHRSVVLNQVANGVLVRMAVLYQLLGGAALGGTSAQIDKSGDSREVSA